MGKMAALARHRESPKGGLIVKAGFTIKAVFTVITAMNLV